MLLVSWKTKTTANIYKQILLFIAISILVTNCFPLSACHCLRYTCDDGVQEEGEGKSQCGGRRRGL